VTSKLWNTFHKREHVRPALERTLADLGLEYLDLYLIHFPVSLKYVDPTVRHPAEWYYEPETSTFVTDNVPIRETWEAMEELVDAGLVKNIGVSNFSAALIQDILKYARIKPAVLQIEHHPYLVQDTLVKYAKSQNIAITGYSSFGAQSYVELTWDKAVQCPSLLHQKIITDIAHAHGKSAAQVLLKWAVQRGIAVIPKSNNYERLLENLDLFGFSLSDQEIHEISALNVDLRFNDPGEYMGIELAIFA